MNKSDQNNYFRHGLYLKPVISDLNLNLFLTSFFLITWLKFKIKNLSVPMEKILPKQSQKPLDISRIYHRFIWINIGQSTNKGTSSSSLISLTVILICHLRKQHNLKSVVLSRHNRTKGRFKKNKARLIFRKTNNYCPCAYEGERNVRFSENLACLVFLKHPSWDSPFCLITDEVYIRRAQVFQPHNWVSQLTSHHYPVSTQVAWLAPLNALVSPLYVGLHDIKYSTEIRSDTFQLKLNIFCKYYLLQISATEPAKYLLPKKSQT